MEGGNPCVPLHTDTRLAPGALSTCPSQPQGTGRGQAPSGPSRVCEGFRHAALVPGPSSFCESSCFFILEVEKEKLLKTTRIT